MCYRIEKMESQSYYGHDPGGNSWWYDVSDDLKESQVSVMKYHFQRYLHGWRLMNEQGIVLYQIVKEVWKNGIDILNQSGDFIGESQILKDHDHRYYLFEDHEKKKRVEAQLRYAKDAKIFRGCAPSELIISCVDMLYVFVKENDYLMKENNTKEWIKRASFDTYECESERSGLLLSILFTFTMFIRQEQESMIV